MNGICKRSIRSQLLCWLLIPLCMLWLVSTIIAYYLAAGFADDAYDQQLLNSASSVAAQIESDGKDIIVDLPPAAQAIVRHSTQDKIYYQILDHRGQRISGDAIIPGPVNFLQTKPIAFRYASMNGQPVRIVRLRVNISFLPDKIAHIQVAETLHNRHHFTNKILLSIAFPQLLLILSGAIAIAIGVTRGLAPLNKLEIALASRSRLDLTPLEEETAPKEVQPLLRALNDLFSRLRDDIEAQQRFVANAAHQFRTPLAGLKTYVFAASQLPADQKMTEMLTHIDTGVERLSGLARKLLILAKSDPSNQTHSYEITDLNSVATEIVEEFQIEALSRNICLKLTLAESPALILGDFSDLTELIANLVENAILYTPASGSVSVLIEANQQVTLIVEDNGPGIAEEHREKVFERFYRILGNCPSGSGLGLPIVKEIATAHGAIISLGIGQNERGTKISVIFPAHISPRNIEETFDL
ncbi:MAG: sensor histidine kinase N-terminal domain-containing protein [Candidatus Obscuribacterales bacterium]